MPETNHSFYVGEWLVEPDSLRVSDHQIVKKVEPQLMAVLQVLAKRPNEVVSKQDLMEIAWEGVIVSENVLTRAISSLRKILEDSRQDPQYIETISKKGYRLIAGVRSVEMKQVSRQKVSGSTRNIMLLSGSILIILILAASISGNLVQAPAPKVFHPFALANYSNSEYYPAISPDGKFVAYSWKGKKDDNWDIYLKQVGTEAIVRLTSHPSADLRAKWSPDGNYLYFIRYEKGEATIMKQSMLGRQEIRVIEAPSYSFGEYALSPDEEWLIYNDRERPSDPRRLKRLSLQTGEASWLSSPPSTYQGDIHPTFSPDGRKLAFIRERNAESMQLWLLDLSSKDFQQLTNTHQSINGFDWAVDGQTLIYSSDQSGLYKLWTVNLAGQQPSILPISDDQLVMPRIAESGQLVYAKMQDDVNIWSCYPQQKSSHLWHGTSGLDLNPVFSPDGKQVCFTMLQKDKFQIWISKADGSAASPLTQFEGQNISAPCWSPDGKWIVFQGFADGQSDIFRVPSNGGIIENLTHSPEEEHTPFVANSGEIYYCAQLSDGWSIWNMQANGSKKKQVIGGQAYAPQLDVEGKSLIYCQKDTFGLWKLDLESLDESLLIPSFHPLYWGAYRVSKKGIYFFNPQQKEIEFYDFQSDQSSPVFKPEKRLASLGISISVSPDGSQILFCQIDHHDADIMLAESR